MTERVFDAGFEKQPSWLCNYIILSDVEHDYCDLKWLLLLIWSTEYFHNISGCLLDDKWVFVSVIARHDVNIKIFLF